MMKSKMTLFVGQPMRNLVTEEMDIVASVDEGLPQFRGDDTTSAD
jgi:hypothetical protein